MAYLRGGQQELEVDFPLQSIWEAIPKAVAKLEWEIQEKDEVSHRITIKTKDDVMFYGSLIKIELEKINEKTTYVSIDAETPVTTITSVLDFGQTTQRIDLFVLTLANIMNS